MRDAEKNMRYWLALARMPASSTKIFSWLDCVDDLDLFFSVPGRQLKHIGITDEVEEYLNAIPWQIIMDDIYWQNQSSDNYIVTYDDPYYPKLLKEITNPPLVLYVKGDIELLNSPQLAIVGSRNPSPNGQDIAKIFAKHLAQLDITVTSGLALGIDAASHSGALQAESGKTIAVLGTGLDVIYPAQNKTLANNIVSSGGALVSEFSPATEARPQNFPQRNRIISGMSLGTLVVEAALRSGSLITARFATNQGREVFAIPGSIHNPLAKGCHKLIRQGAKLVETANDILEELGPLANLQKNLTIEEQQEHRIDDFIKEDDSYKKLLENLDVTATPVDILSQRTHLPVAEISSMLLVLELKGYVESAPSGYLKKQRTLNF